MNAIVIVLYMYKVGQNQQSMCWKIKSVAALPFCRGGIVPFMDCAHASMDQQFADTDSSMGPMN